MGDTEQNLNAVLLVLVLLQDSSGQLLLVFGELMLLVYFSFLNKLDICQKLLMRLNYIIFTLQIVCHKNADFKYFFKMSAWWGFARDL